MKLLTRQQIREIWKGQPNFLNKLCCPDCRDLLFEEGEYLVCANLQCRFDSIKKSEIEKL